MLLADRNGLPAPVRLRPAVGQQTGNEVACEIAPMTDQTKLFWPCSSSHGWKWSEIHSPSNPASSAMLAYRQARSYASVGATWVAVTDGARD